MKSRSLLAQVLAVNLLLVAGTMLVATVALHQQIAGITQSRELLILGLAVIATMLADWILLRRRFMPLDQLIRAMEQLEAPSAAPPSERPRGQSRRPGAGARAPENRPGPPRRGQPGAHSRLDPPAGIDRTRPPGAAARAA